MKKIMTVSLMAMMVVGAARADIASVGYVEDKLATKANVSDVTSISNKLGTIADGKTVVDLIEAAKQDAIDGVAAYDDTEVRVLISDNADAISELETKVGDTSVADQIDAVRATTIAGLSEEEKTAKVPTVKLTELMIQTSTNEIGGSVAQNATAIQNINNSDVMKSGITPAKVTEYDGYAGAISDNAAAINTEKLARESADTELAGDIADVNAKFADYTKTSDLDTTYVSESEMSTFKSSNTTAIAEAKQAGTDAAAALETYKITNNAAVAANKTATETNAASIAAMAQAGIKAEGTGDGTYALTMKVTGDVRTFQWDKIGY